MILAQHAGLEHYWLAEFESLVVYTTCLADDILKVNGYTNKNCESHETLWAYETENNASTACWYSIDFIHTLTMSNFHAYQC